MISTKSKNLLPVEGNELLVQISANLQYLKTYDYDLFSFYPTNRVPTHWGKILQSIEIQDLTDRQPILVYRCPNTLKLFISDGQNRYLACKKSKRPIYAIVVTGESLNKGESSLAVLNSYQKNWSKEDFMDYFCAKGFESYINLKKAKIETGFNISALQKLSSLGPYDRKTKYENGDLEYTELDIKNARVVHRVLSSIEKHKLSIVNIARKSTLIDVIGSFLRAGAKSREMVSQLAKYGNLFEPCGSGAQYFRMLEHIYNYRKHNSNKESFKYSKLTISKRILLK